jgi:prophage regulatory protein
MYPTDRQVAEMPEVTDVAEEPQRKKPHAQAEISKHVHAATLYLTDRQVAERLAVSRATIWRWVRRGAFPAPLKFSPGITRWNVSDLERWEAECAAATGAA